MHPEVPNRAKGRFLHALVLGEAEVVLRAEIEVLARLAARRHSCHRADPSLLRAGVRPEPRVFPVRTPRREGLDAIDQPLAVLLQEVRRAVAQALLAPGSVVYAWHDSSSLPRRVDAPDVTMEWW